MERAYAIAYGITHNHHDAEDLSQEAFIKVWNSINSFTGKSKFLYMGSPYSCKSVYRLSAETFLFKNFLYIGF